MSKFSPVAVDVDAFIAQSLQYFQELIIDGISDERKEELQRRLQAFLEELKGRDIKEVVFIFACLAYNIIANAANNDLSPDHAAWVLYTAVRWARELFEAASGK